MNLASPLDMRLQDDLPRGASAVSTTFLTECVPVDAHFNRMDGRSIRVSRVFVGLRNQPNQSGKPSRPRRPKSHNWTTGPCRITSAP